jgi:bacterioferritin
MKDSSRIVDELIKSYWLEMETVQNYLANAVNLDGVRAEEIKRALEADIQEELGHAQRLAKRIHVLGGRVPGSVGFKPVQTRLQPPSDTTDLVTVIKGVVEAEEAAIAQYRKIIELCEGEDYVTQDICIELLGSEEEHRREFLGFLTEFSR